jgi:hypothetical protein
MVTKLTRLTHKIAIQLHVVAAVPFAVLAPGGQSGNFWIQPRLLQFHTNRCGILNMSTNGDRWSASRTGCFTLRDKSPRYPFGRKLGRPPIRYGHSGGEKKISMPLPGITPWSSSLYIVTVLSELYWLRCTLINCSQFRDLRLSQRRFESSSERLVSYL